MINKHLLALIFFGISLYAFSQKKDVIYGRVIENSSKENIEEANILVFDTNDSLIYSTTSNSSGLYKIEIPNNLMKIKIVCNYIGYYSKTYFILRSDIINDTIKGN